MVQGMQDDLFSETAVNNGQFLRKNEFQNNTTENLDELSNIECKYRKCSNKLTFRKLKNGAKFCQDDCRINEWIESQPEKKVKENLEKFRKFHAENPHVYDRMVELARKAMLNGHKHGSARDLFGFMRWSYMTTKSDDYKLNNNYPQFYARLIRKQEPDLADFFELRHYRIKNDDMV